MFRPNGRGKCTRRASLRSAGRPRRLSPRFLADLNTENLFGCFGAGAYAVGDADATVAIAGECEAGQLLAEALDTVEAFEVAYAVLRHGGLPFIDAGEDWRGAES